MINAATAIVTTGFFTHYCHPGKSFMVLRIHHEACPICLQKNPAYIPNTPIWTILSLDTGSTVLTFKKEAEAIKFIYEHPLQNLALGDTGLVQ